MSAGITPSDYVLGELTPEQLAEAESMVREDPEFRAEVEALRPVVARLEELPEAGWEGVGEPEVRDRLPSRARRTWLPQLRPAMAMAASLLLIAVGVAAGAALFGDDGSDGSGQASERIALEPLGTAATSAQGTGTPRPRRRRGGGGQGLGP